MRKRRIAWLLTGVLAINSAVPIISIAASEDDSYYEEYYDYDTEYEEYDSEQVSIESDGEISIDEIKRGVNIDLDVGDLVVSDTLISSSSGKVRVAEVYSINNNLAD